MRFSDFQSRDLINRTIVNAWLLCKGKFRTPCCSHCNVQVGINSHPRIMHDHLKLDSAVSRMQRIFRSIRCCPNSTSMLISSFRTMTFQGHVVVRRLDDCTLGASLIYNCMMTMCSCNMNIQMQTIIGFTEYRLVQVLLHYYPSMDKPRPISDSSAVKSQNIPRQSSYKFSGTGPKAPTVTSQELSTSFALENSTSSR